MLPDSIQLKDTDEIQAYYSHEEAHDDGDIPVSKHRKLKWKLDLLFYRSFQVSISSPQWYTSIFFSSKVPILI